MYQDKKSKSRIKNKGNLFVWGLVMVVMAAIAVGDVEPASPVGAGAGENIKAGDVSTNKTIRSIAFEEGMTITGALRILGELYQKNIVPSPKVDGILSFRKLRNVTFKEAMEAILGVNLKYEQEGNLIKVYTKDEYKKLKEDTSRMIHKVFTLYYITAEEAKKLVTPVLSKASLIQGSTAAEEGISTSEKGVSGEKPGGDSMALHDTLVVYDYPENIAKAEEVIAALDIRPKQVLIEATILSATLTEGMSLGVDLNLLGGVSLDGTSSTAQIGTTSSLLTTTTTPVSQIAAGVAGSAIETSGFASVGGGGLRIGVRSGSVSAFITALESVTDITVLANPKILALNKQAGTVFIGTKLGYRSQTTQTDTSTTQKVTFLDTGTKLSFRPYIADDGYIRMDIYPKDSSGELDAEGIPTETTAELTTNVMVKDGETIVIGGLFRDDVRTIRSQIPLLGDLPFIGAIFRSTTDSNIRQEIIVMLTPHIITESEDTDADARAADISRKRYGARMAIQNISRAKLADDYYVNAVRYYADGNSVEALCELDEALEVRPTFIEALRLKERIMGEVSPDEAGQIERIMLGVIERQEAKKWMRR